MLIGRDDNIFLCIFIDIFKVIFFGRDYILDKMKKRYTISCHSVVYYLMHVIERTAYY